MKLSKVGCPEPCTIRHLLCAVLGVNCHSLMADVELSVELSSYKHEVTFFHLS